MRGAFAVITGASQGLGEAFAEACAARGWNLILCALAGTGLEAVASRLRQEHGAEVIARELDLLLPAARAEFVSFAAARGRVVGLLVNNVGYSRHGYFDLMPIEIPRRIVEVNILAGLEITRGLIPALRRSAPSSIITVSSLSAFRPMPLVSVYGSSKTFLLHWALSLGLELRALGISSTVLCPGPIYTSPEVRARIAAQGLGARLAAMQPRAVAEAALRGAARRKAVVIPGAFNKLVHGLTALLPRGIFMAGVYRRWKGSLGRSRSGVDYEFFEER